MIKFKNFTKSKKSVGILLLGILALIVVMIFVWQNERVQAYAAIGNQDEAVLIREPSYEVMAGMWEEAFSALEARGYDLSFIKQDSNEMTPLWTADGPNGSKMRYRNGGVHQVLAGRAMDYAFSRVPSLFGGTSIWCSEASAWTTEERRAFVRYSDWPDHPGVCPVHGELLPNAQPCCWQWDPRGRVEREPFIGAIPIFFPVGQWSNNHHFYNPNTGRNFFNNNIEPGVNARTRTVHFFNRAVGTYQGIYHSNQNYNWRRVQSMRYLGKASHFISDISAPVHTGDVLPNGSPGQSPLWIATQNAYHLAQIGYYHSTFESVAQEELNRVANGQISDFFPAVQYRRFPNAWTQSTASNRISQLAHLVAVESYSRYHLVSDTGLFNWITDETRREVAHETLPLAVDANAAMLIMFAEAVGYIVGTFGLQISDTTVTGFVAQPGFDGRINIPQDITTIGSLAFAHQVGITSVHIPSTVGSVNVNIKNNDYFTKFIY